MLVVDLHADDFVLDPEFLAHPAIVELGPSGALVILAALLTRHRSGAPVPRAVLEHAVPRPAALKAIAAAVRLGLLVPVLVEKRQAYELAGYAAEAGTDGGTRRRRVLGALRSRRFRARGDRAVDVPLPFDALVVHEQPEPPDPDRSGSRGLWKTGGKTCAKPVTVTQDVTHPVTHDRSAAESALSSLEDLDLEDHRRQAPDRTGTAPHGAAHAVSNRERPGRVPFRVLCAVVRREASARPELAADRLELLEHVKGVCARARLPYRGDAVAKAIEAVAVAEERRA